MKKVKVGFWSGARGTAALAMGGAALLTGCVLPGEFDAVNNECASPNFDVETRDAFCSGSISSRIVHEEAGFSSDEKPLVQVQGNFISIVDPLPQGGVNLRLLERSGFEYEEISNEFIDVFADGPLTSFAVMGLGSAGFDPDTATVALVYGRENLRFAPVRASQRGDEPEPGDPEPDGPEPVEPGLFDGEDIVTEEAREAFGGEGCEPDEEGRQFPVVDVAAMTSKQLQGHDYLMVAARCAMTVYAKRPNGSPFLLNQYPIKAMDIEVDLEGDRMFVASGLDGLQVRNLTSFQRQLDNLLGAQADFEDDSPANCPEGEEGCEDRGGDPDLAAFTPGIGGLDGFTSSDPSIQAITNVTRVSFTGDKVFFINSPVDSGNDQDDITYLVAGDLAESGLLQSRRSIPIARESLVEGDFEWSVVGLDESLVAVLSNRTEVIDGNLTISSQIKLFDAPNDITPTFVMDLPLTGVVNGIQLHDGELWAFQRDLIAGYSINVGGDPL